jgi:hypothetical protein
VLEGSGVEGQKKTYKGVQQRGGQRCKRRMRKKNHSHQTSKMVMRGNDKGKKDKKQLRVGPRTTTQETARRIQQRLSPDQCRNRKQLNSDRKGMPTEDATRFPSDSKRYK